MIPHKVILTIERFDGDVKMNVITPCMNLKCPEDFHQSQSSGFIDVSIQLQKLSSALFDQAETEGEG